MTSPHLPFGERRLNFRKKCSRMVQINDQNGSYSGHLRDLAMGGAFIESPDGSVVRTGQELVLTIPYGLKKAFLTIKARVAWARPHGMGVRFIDPNPVD